MRLSLAIRTLGILLLLYAGALLPTLIVSIIYQDGLLTIWGMVSLGCGLAGGLLWFIAPRDITAIRTRDGFAIVSMFWLFTSLIGSLPLLISLDITPAAALFESASALTTTGATVIIGLDALPQSILFYRQEMQWLGGVGIILSAVALLPMLGVGGMQLYKAETAGPIKDDKLTPRMVHAARNLWYIYAGMTVVCAALYWLGGMSAFDAIAHSLSTVSTGGFSTHDASFGFFDSVFLEAVAIVFMILGSISFNVHFIALARGQTGAYWQNLEVRTYIFLILAITLVITINLAWPGITDHGLAAALRLATFETVSVISSTGYGIDDFSLWPGMLPMFIIFVSFLGGCAGSTAGGMKIIRHMVLFKFFTLQLTRLVHPSIEKPVKIGDRIIEAPIVDAVGAYFVLYAGTYGLLLLLLQANGLDFETSFGAVAACLNNLGPGLGEVAGNFTTMNSFTHVLMTFAMILGRLELFTILVLFSPALWRF